MIQIQLYKWYKYNYTNGTNTIKEIKENAQRGGSKPSEGQTITTQLIPPKRHWKRKLTKITVNSGNNTQINAQPSQSILDVLRHDMKENCQNTHHPSSLPCLIFPPFLCSWIRIEGFIFSPTVFVFPPCSSNRREGTSRKHTVISQNNTLACKICLSSFCFCFILKVYP